VTATKEKINREWHSIHRMPANPTKQQRLEWHLEHVENCCCRPVPKSLKAEVERQTKVRGGRRAN